MDNSYEPSSVSSHTSHRKRHEASLSPGATTPPAYEPARPDATDEGTSDHQGVLDPSAAAEYTPSPIASQQRQQQKLPSPQSSLLVTKLPWRLNDFQQLHEHFSRFGSLVDIQTNFAGQSSQALVTYATPSEAEAAYRSPEPILANRFIRLALWPPGPGGPGRFQGGGGRGRFRGHRHDGGALGFSQHGQVRRLLTMPCFILCSEHVKISDNYQCDMLF